MARGSTNNNSPDTRRGIPKYIAHFVVRTSRFAESVAWYTAYFDAEVVYSQDGLTFLTWDDEHHRIAIIGQPDLGDFGKNVAGIDHIAFSMPDIAELVAAYKRLKNIGILPTYSINHGPTTSLYYTDPDGVMNEIQVDNTAFPGGARAFFGSEEFVKNPIGVFFDPDALAARFESGEDESTLLARPDGPIPELV